MSLRERAARTLRDIQKTPGNEVCADCGAPGESRHFTWLCAGAEDDTRPNLVPNVRL